MCAQASEQGAGRPGVWRRPEHLAVPTAAWDTAPTWW